MSTEFMDQLAEFLREHNKTLDDVQKPLDENVPEGIKRQVIEHIHRVEDTGHNRSSYRRLRTFSGKCPVPNGELAFTNWVQHAQQMVDEPGTSEEEKKSRLAEGLAPPSSGPLSEGIPVIRIISQGC